MFEAEWHIKIKDRRYDSLLDEILAIREEENDEPLPEISIDALTDPFLHPGIPEAVERIITAREKREKIFVYGDYDADGLTSSAILIRILQMYGLDAECFIPDRFDDGYGLNVDSLGKLVSKQADLVITTDCGINSINEVDYLNENGVDAIITDHHVLTGKKPAASAVVYADKNDADCPFRKMSGAGVALKLADALNRRLNLTTDMRNLYALASIGTIADIVPLVGENRILAGLGLAYLNQGCLPGAQAILEAAGKSGGYIDSYSIGFIIAPRLNAAGRMGSPEIAFEILKEEDSNKALVKAGVLNDLNTSRQRLQKEVVDKVEKAIAADKSLAENSVIVSALDGNYKGVVGIAATKITEKYMKPSIILSLDNGIAEGSGRSAWDFSLIKSLDYCSKVLEKYGGHHNAAGLALKETNLIKFRKLLNEYAEKNGLTGKPINILSADCEADPLELSLADISKFSYLEPIGSGNKAPVFLLKNMKLSGYRVIGKTKKHLSLGFEKDGQYFRCISFGSADYEPLLYIGEKYDIAFNAGINDFRGNKSVQLNIIDMRFCGQTGNNIGIPIVRLAANMLKYEKNNKLLYRENIKSALYNTGMPSSASDLEIIINDYLLDREFVGRVYNIIRKYLGNELAIDEEFKGFELEKSYLAVEILSELGILKAVPLGMYRYLIKEVDNSEKKDLTASKIFCFFAKEEIKNG